MCIRDRDKAAQKFEDSYLDELFSELYGAGVRAVTYMPVSYTHLDVYKRQLYALTISPSASSSPEVNLLYASVIVSLKLTCPPLFIGFHPLVVCFPENTHPIRKFFQPFIISMPKFPAKVNRCGEKYRAKNRFVHKIRYISARNMI